MIVCRQACGIDLGTSYVVTGGVYSDQRVTQYSLTGKMTRLPDLNERRFDHACSQFVDNDGVTVSTERAQALEQLKSDSFSVIHLLDKQQGTSFRVFSEVFPPNEEL